MSYTCGYLSRWLVFAGWTIGVCTSGYSNTLIEVTIRDTVAPLVPGEREEAPMPHVEAATVVVSGRPLDQQLHLAPLGITRLTSREAKELPSLLGEVDVLRALMLKPGMPSGAEGAAGLYVRGGGADQNLFLLDGATVYNPSHLFGFFGTFNADAVEDVTLYKGGFPARYGGRLSSVIDVGLRDGRRDKVGLSGGIGLLSSRLTAEGPLGPRDEDGQAPGSWIVSGRRTYVDFVTKAINRSRAREGDRRGVPDYLFYDLNAKVKYRLGSRDQLSISAFRSGDAFAVQTPSFEFELDWGNVSGAMHWQHLLGDKTSVTTSASVSQYRYESRNRVPGYGLNLGSEVAAYTARSEVLSTWLRGHEIRLGGQLTHHRFGVGRLRAGSNDGELAFSKDLARFGTEAAVYFSDDFDLGPRLRVSAGLRLSAFGSLDYYDQGFEPRLSANYRLSEDVSLKLNYARMNQYVHLVTTAGLALPTDLWYPSTRGIGPQRGHQVGIGTSWAPAEGYAVEAEVYGKSVTGLVDFVDGAQLFANADLEGEFDQGSGYAYGFELEVRREVGRLTGWVGYTYQKTRRGRFAHIMDGRYFSPRHDRRHDVSVVASYRLSERWRCNAAWVYGSGDLYWVPVGRAFAQGGPGANASAIVPIYGDRNNYRLRAFHRADLGVVFELRPRWGASDLTFGVFNVYDRRNAFFVYLDVEYQTVQAPDGLTYEIPRELTPRQVSLFPILPSLTWNFKL